MSRLPTSSPPVSDILCGVHVGGTDVHHRATIQRGPSPSGPWEDNPNNPILFNGADLNNNVQNTGHADITEGADGRWWGVALGVRPQNGNTSHIQLGQYRFSDLKT